MRKISIITLYAVALGGLLYTGVAFAAENFQPIVPWSIPVTEETSIGQFLNMLFRFSITAAAALAIAMIIVGGFQYIGSGAMEGKKDGRARIQGAVMGLILLLISYLILYQINPQILELDVLDRVGEVVAPPSGSPPVGTYTGTYTGSDVVESAVLNPTDSNAQAVAANDFVSRCAERGGEVAATCYFPFESPPDCTEGGVQYECIVR